jgi:Holliday junction resolvase RusA-like endonuclease
MKNQLNFIIGAKKILSVNALYSSKIIYKTGHPISTIYKTGEAKKVEEYIKEQVRLLDVPKNYTWINKNTLFKLTLTVVFRNGLLMRDLDNTQKLVIDGIFRALGLNDSHIVEICANKCICPEISEEKICVSLEEVSNLNKLRFNYIPLPEVVWCEEDLLDYKDLPKRKTKGNIYKTADKESANTLVYILDPTKGISYNTFGDIREDLMYVSREIKLAYIFIIGCESDWGIDVWKDIREFENIVSEYSSNYSGINLNYIESIDNIKEIIK